jgi:nucleotide-binding universal stress UspA family protein
MSVDIGKRSRRRRAPAKSRMKQRSRPPERIRISSVLVPLDGSTFAEQALPWAIAIARKARARLRLALVHQVPQPPPLDEASIRLHTQVELVLRKSQREYLRRVAARIKGEQAIQVATAMLEGRPAPALRDYVRELGVDLVVVTTHGRGGIERAWLGSVADQLVRGLEIPLLLIRPKEGAAAAPRVEEILVPLDGSRRAEAALPAALSMAALLGSRLSLVQAVQPIMLGTDLPTSFPGGYDEELTAIRRREAQDYLDGIAEQLTGLGVPASAAAVLGGTAFDTIQAATRAPATGMVALATHGRGGLRRLVLGSVADKVVRAGELPVLVTRPRGR